MKEIDEVIERARRLARRVCHIYKVNLSDIFQAGT